MAFKNVNQRSKVDSKRSLTDFAVGESFTGHVVNIKKYFSEEYEREMQSLLAIEEGTGKSFVFYPSGNVKYMITDGKIEVGLLTRITRVADKKVKGKKSSQFTVEQDPDNTINVEEAMAALALSPADESDDGGDGEEAKPQTRSEAKRNSILDKAKKLEQAGA